MTPDEMLAYLSLTGGDAASDFNDSDDVNGWFGWTVDGGILTVTYEASLPDGDIGPRVTSRWRLIPLATPSVSEPAGGAE
jgi:hypothetical protein